jgi:hypothetical protein
LLEASAIHFPSLRTLAVGASLFFKISMALSALFSCQKPTTPFMRRSKKMMAKSSQRLNIAERRAAASIIQGMVPQK